MIDRRSFLAAGAAASLSTLSNAQPTKERKLKKSLKYGMVGEGGSVLEKFRIVKEVGYDGIELDSPNGFSREEVLEAKEATGLEIPGVVDSAHWRHTLGDPRAEVRAKGVAALETALRDCHAYGGTTVLLVPGVVTETMAYGDVYRRSQDEVRKVLPLAKELGIQIAIENVWNHFLLSPLEAARYCDELDPSVVGWYLDVGNLIRNAWPEHWVQALGKRIFKLDIKEYSRKKRDDEGLWKGFGVGIGEGDCGWPRVMAALDGIGYEGWASAEVGGGDRKRLADILSRMERVLDA